MRANPRNRDANMRLGLLAQAGPLGDVKAAAECARRGIAVARAHGEGGQTVGGVLVPDELLSPIVTMMEKHGLFRRYANRARMTRDAASKPRRVGGASVVNPSEGQAISEGDLRWDSVNLTARKPSALARVSSELAEDAEALGEEIADEFARALAETEDRIGFAGDGSGADFGVKGLATILQDGQHAGGAVPAGSGHNTFASIDVADLGGLVARLPVRSHAEAAWWISPVGFGLTFCRLAQAIGGLHVIGGEVHALGFPVRLTPTLPSVTTTLAGKAMLLLGDLNQAAVFGDRRELVIARSANGPATFDADDLMFRGTERVDIVNHDLGDATTTGAMVALIGTA